MLSFEWQELETLSDRVKSLNHRHAAAQRSEQGSHVEWLSRELARVERQREVLLRYILVRHGVLAAERNRLRRGVKHHAPERV
jgi:hypothetical protein